MDNFQELKDDDHYDIGYIYKDIILIDNMTR